MCYGKKTSMVKENETSYLYASQAVSIDMGQELY